MKIFADDTTTFRPLHDPGEYSCLQDNLDRLVEWSTLWQLHFNGSKFKVLHMGNSNPKLQMIRVYINNTIHITIANIYIPPRGNTSAHYKTIDTDIQHGISHITNMPHSDLTGDVNAHFTLWHSYTDDHRG